MTDKHTAPTLAQVESDTSETFWQQLTVQTRHSRRSYPRVHADISVHVVGLEEQPIRLRSRDISFGGLQIRCDIQTCIRVLRLKQDTLITQIRHRANPVAGMAHLQLEIRLLVGGTVRKIQCLTRVAHYVRIPGSLPSEAIAIGFQFLGFKDQGKRTLYKFVEENMIPAGY